VNAPDRTRDDLIQLVFELVQNELSVGDDFSPRSNLVAAGLDSLAVTQLLLAIEETTGVFLDESLLTPETLECVETLAARVHEQLGAA
jgi:acyl carrier protein